MVKLKRKITLTKKNKVLVNKMKRDDTEKENSSKKELKTKK